MNILILCTGNICRSPVAEHLLQASLGHSQLGESVKVSSAGTHVNQSSPIHLASRQLLETNGFQVHESNSKQVDLETVRSSDLILVMAAEHRAFVAHLDPTSNRKCFTLGEYARICNFLSSKPEFSHSKADYVLNGSALGPIGLKLVLAEKYRGYAPKAQALEDIADPLEVDSQSFEKTFEEIDAYLKVISEYWELV